MEQDDGPAMIVLTGIINPGPMRTAIGRDNVLPFTVTLQEIFGAAAGAMTLVLFGTPIFGLGMGATTGLIAAGAIAGRTLVTSRPAGKTIPEWLGIRLKAAATGGRRVQPVIATAAL